METIYNISIDKNTIVNILNKQQKLTFKLLPMLEEGQEWEKLLETVIVEFLGMQGCFPKLENLVSLIFKLKGLEQLSDDFMAYRRTIFECCSLIDKLKKDID